ncbi:hypothetical protein [Loigolactobacillus iwatensis]|uniref:hypothetical protein n=1 Tax=Loigolactobacillus iwatensis TaxID=1267156 RepID=UPI000F7F7B6E|nr:hypothetical protein [Loigolactobacillus iwatensis]
MQIQKIVVQDLDGKKLGNYSGRLVETAHHWQLQLTDPVEADALEELLVKHTDQKLNFNQQSITLKKVERGTVEHQKDSNDYSHTTFMIEK